MPTGEVGLARVIIPPAPQLPPSFRVYILRSDELHLELILILARGILPRPVLPVCYSVVQKGRSGTELQDLRRIGCQKHLNSLRLCTGRARQSIFRKKKTKKLLCSVSVSGLLPVIKVGGNLTLFRNVIRITQIGKQIHENSNSFLIIYGFAQLPNILPSVLCANLSTEAWFLGPFPSPIL